MTVESLILHYSQTTPEKTALISGGKEVSYADLWNEIGKRATWAAAHARRGDRVVVSASKSMEFVYAYFGFHLAGMVCVPLDPETNETRLRRIIDTAKPSLIVGELRHHAEYNVIPFSETSAPNCIHAFTLPNENDIADLIYTTGTTGSPKGVVLTFANQMAAAQNINEFIGNGADDTELLALPISHSFGLGRMRCVLSTGGTLVLLGSFASMKRFFGEMERCQVTGFGMVPASWAYILKMSGERIGKYAKQLRYIEIGSAFMPLVNKKRLMELLPDTHICMHYGLTEASRSTFISFHDEEDYLDTAGRPSPNTEVAVFDEHGKTPPIGEDGEICVKGAHVCSGYWGVPSEEFLKDFYGEYFKTGDWGHLDKEGYVHLVSRKKEIINVGGKKVSPMEVEEVLNEIDGIEESACVGIHDDVLGEVVKAFCVCKEDLDFEEVKRQITKKLENYKVPAFFERINHLPKTASGKMQRLLLHEN